MKIKDFFNYKTHCPVCFDKLSSNGYLNILVDSIDNNSFEFAGSICYNYNKNKFLKNEDGLEFSSAHRKRMFIIKDNIESSFKIGKNSYLEINKELLSNLINPWKISTVDFALDNYCKSKIHIYGYNSSIILEDDAIYDVNIQSELLGIHDYRMYYYFKNQNKPKTQIEILSESSSIEKFDLPYIPINKWKIDNKISLKTQVDSYLLLK